MSTEPTDSKHVIEALELDIDLTKADLDFPVFTDQLVKVRIVGAQILPNKEESGRNLVITGQSEEKLTSTTGREFAAGKRTFKKYLSLQPSKKSPDWDWTGPLAEMQLAATGQRNTKLNVQELGGKIVYFKVVLDSKANRNNVDKVFSVKDVEEDGKK